MPHQNLLKVGVAPRRRNAIISIFALTLAFSHLAGSARAAGEETLDDTFPASIAATGEYADGSTGERPSISGNGRYVAFLSGADNLGEQGPQGVNEAYVKDLDTGEVELASRAGGLDGEPANEPGEGSGVENVLISGDGRYVTFTSDASNLVAGLPPAEEPGEHPLHIYRRDLQSGETVLVDRVTGLAGAILDERKPEAEGISEEGRYVLFRDRVADLESPTGPHEAGLSTVYVRDLQTGKTTAVSRASGPAGELANEKSRAGSISPDGRYVAFTSSATNLVAGMEADTVAQVYLRDLQTHTTTLVSKTTPGGEPGNASSGEAILVGSDGCRVAFASAATNLLLLESQPLSTPEVYLADLCTTPVSTTLISRANGEAGAPAGEGNAVPPTPLGASADGRYVLFSALSELTGEISSASTHLYLRDLGTGTTTLLDRASAVSGAPADSNPEGGAISANGCRVSFATEADNLGVPQAPRERNETYVRQLAPCREDPTITPTSVNFGTQALDTIGSARTITVKAGSEALTIEHVQPSTADASDFVVTADRCSGETLRPGEQCTFVVRFAPGATGPRAAMLSVRTDTAAMLEVSLTGEGGQAEGGGTGAAGVTGAVGPQGSAGPQGIPGQRGSAGVRGSRGSRGPAGHGGRVICRRVARTTHKVRCPATHRGKQAARNRRARSTCRSQRRRSRCARHLSRDARH